MNVHISDPGRKKERTDAGSKEIRVTGVAKSVKKSDLESLFSKVSQAPLVLDLTNMSVAVRSSKGGAIGSCGWW